MAKDKSPIFNSSLKDKDGNDVRTFQKAQTSSAKANCCGIDCCNNTISLGAQSTTNVLQITYEAGTVTFTDTTTGLSGTVTLS